MTVLILSSMLIVGLGAADILNKSLQITKISQRSGIAYLAAETGAERLLYMAKNNLLTESYFESNCPNDYVDLDTSTCDTNKKHYINPPDYYYKVKYSKDPATGFHVFTSIGYNSNTRRSIEARYAR